MTDGELVRQALSGEPSAYEALVRRHAPRVAGTCHARVGRAAAAEDLAQETLLRGLRALPTLAEPEKFGSWICGIASRVCLDWLKRAERSEVSLAATAADGDGLRFVGRAGDASEALAHADELARLMSEVERLPPPLREALLLYYYEDVTYAELAKRLGVSAATVNARLTQARMALRRTLNAGDLRREDVKT
jgi:RNA polymerase sigma-70 factor (ECF subfamily)